MLDSGAVGQSARHQYSDRLEEILCKVNFSLEELTAESIVKQLCPIRGAAVIHSAIQMLGEIASFVMRCREDRQWKEQIDVTHPFVYFTDVLADVGDTRGAVKLVIQLLAVDVSATSGRGIEQLSVLAEAIVQIDNLIA